MSTSHALVVALSVNLDVFDVALFEFLHCSFDMLHTTLRTHLSGGNVGVETSAIPVAGDGLRLKRDLCAEFFGNSVQEPARHPELVAQVDANARTNLVFPLSGHDFGICARDFNTSIHASLVVSLDNISAVDSACANTAVVGALWSGETTLGPTIWPAILTEESVFLLKTEPDLVLGICFHQSCGFMAVVGFVRCSIRVPSLAHD